MSNVFGTIWSSSSRDHGGFVRFYCIEHKPAPVVAAAVAPGRAAAARRSAPAEKRPPVRRATHDDRIRAMCPNCFIEVSATGECGVCGAVA